jgi:type I restriction enzyme S subunit
MPAEWPTVRLEEIASTDRKGFAMGPFGSNIRSKNYQQAGIPVLRGVNLGEAGFIHDDLVFLSEQKAEELKNSQAFPGDVIFVAQGTVGKVGLVPNHPRFQKTVLSQNLMKFSCDRSKCDPRFFYYFFVSTEGQHTIRSHVNPTGVPCISRPLSSLKEFEVPLPPLVEQKGIASVLGALDDKIELNRRMSATLEAMARALFQSWFVDFDPVRAKLDGRQPSGLNLASAALFPNEFEDSELGPIPKGWKIGKVSDGFDLTMGQSPPGETYNEDGKGLPFYQGRADFEFRFTTRRVFCTAPTRYAKPGDTLVSVRAPVGDINMAEEECCVGRGVAAVRHKSGSSSFTYYAMGNFEADFARFEAEGTVFGSINKQDFSELPFIVIPPELVVAYERIASPFDRQIYVLEHQSRTLAAARDALLPKLITGKLRVYA